MTSKIEFSTSEGKGEALRNNEGSWTINLPWTSYRFYGTKDEVKHEVTRKIKEYENNI